MRKFVHLVRRFFGTLSPRPLAPTDEKWAEGLLNSGELELWQRISAADRKHAAGVARRVQVALAEDITDEALVAALLHDVGKVKARLGVSGRVFATVASMAVGRERLTRGNNRMARYLRHDAIGSDLLAQAGSAPLVVAWAREHHLSAAAWSVEPRIAPALKAADDD